MRLLLLLCALSVRAASSACPVDALVLRRGLPAWNQERDETATGSQCAALPARSARACCDACASKGEIACDTFAFRPRDGLCLLAAAKGHCHPVTQSRDWLYASMTAQTMQAGCSAREVAGSDVGQAIQSLKRETEGLQDKLWAFWSLYGPDGVNGGFHTTLDERGGVAPPTVKSARRAAEDLQALSVFADRAGRAGNSRTAQRAQELADAQFGFLMRSFAASENGMHLVDAPGSAATTPQLLSTHLQVISALSAYARVAPNAAAWNAALRAAERQAAAAEKCCHDGAHGGFASRLEVAQGWFPAGTQKTLGAHLSTIHAASSHRNASLSRPNFSTPQRSAPSGALSAAALPELLRLTQRMFAAAPLRAGGAPFVPSLFDEQWRGVGAGGTPPDVDYGANMAVLTTVVSTMRSLADHGRLRVNDSLLAGAIQAARAASEEGYDPSCGGIFERGVPGAAPSGATKLYYEQTSAVTASIWLWRLTGEAVHLCRARHSLARLARVQLAPAGEFYWALADGEGCVAGAPVGMHGSALAEPWKGAASLGSLASLGDLLDEISAEEVAAAAKRPQPAPAAWGPSHAQPSSSTTPSPPPQQRAQTPPSAPWVGDSCGTNATQLRVNESLAETGSLPGGTVNALVVTDAGACCSACLSSAACDTFALRAADGLCVLLRQSNASGDSASRAWLLARPTRRPLSARPQGGCPAALPALATDAQLLDLAGLAGKAGGGSRNTPVRLRAASCSAASWTEMLAAAHIRGESSRRDYPKKSVALKLRKADTHQLFAALGVSPSQWASHPSSSSLILGANYDDTTLLRDWLTFNRSRAMGLAAPLTQPVELSVAGQDQGMYWLTQRPDVIAEQAARANARDTGHVTVASFDPWDEAEEDVFVPLPATLSSRLRLVRPDPGDAAAGDTHARVSALANILAVAASASGNHSAACDWVAFSAVADVGAFVTFFMLNEWSNDPDAYAKSTFLSYDGARLIPGPLWDKNLAFGGRDESAVSGWRALASCSSSCDVLDNAGSLFGLLARHCAPFWTAVAQRWRAARAPGGPMADAAVDAVLREQSAWLLQSGAVARERSRWGRGDARTYAADVAVLGGWSRLRAGWMDAELARKVKE